MLLSLRQLYGKKLGASDGDIGHVRDFYFNDQQWAIRYVVADTGLWLSGRLVLISPKRFDLSATLYFSAVGVGSVFALVRCIGFAGSTF